MTHEEIIAMARKDGFEEIRQLTPLFTNRLERFFHAAYAAGAAAENEACAKVCRSWADDHAKHDNCSYYNCDYVAAAQDCATAIRARRTK